MQPNEATDPVVAREPDASKGARPVLRGGWGREALSLPSSDLFDFSPAAVAALARADAARALAEDLGAGDLTAGLVDPARQARARVLAREPAVICGAPWAQATLDVLAPGAQITWHVAEGQRCQADQVVFEVQAAARALLSAERTMLYFLQLLSAVAT